MRASVPSIYCRCGAQWHGRQSAAAEAEIEQHRLHTRRPDCELITEEAFAAAGHRVRSRGQRLAPATMTAHPVAVGPVGTYFVVCAPVLTGYQYLTADQQFTPDLGAARFYVSLAEIAAQLKIHTLTAHFEIRRAVVFAEIGAAINADALRGMVTPPWSQ